VVLQVCAEDLVTNVMLVAGARVEEISRCDGNTRLIGKKVDQCPARSVDARCLAAIGGRFRRYQTGRKGSTPIDAVDRNRIVLLSQEFKTELQSVVAAREEGIVVELKNLIVEILVRSSPKLHGSS